jgi:hypothetical protein
VKTALVALVLAAGASALTASPATASPATASPATAFPATANVPGPALTRGVAELNLTKAICGGAGLLSKATSIACGALTNGGALLQAGKQLATGKVGGAVSTLTSGGVGTIAATASTALMLAAIGDAVGRAVVAVLHDAASALGATTTPQLRTTWFSATYWRMAAIAAVLTLPFLFAATVQALLRSDVTLLARSALGYLPLAMLAIAVAAPLTTLLLAASDQLCTLISSAAGNAGPHFIGRIILVVGGLTALAKSPFLAFLIGLFTIAAAFALWIELLLREAAVYVVVLMLPLVFAALAWPARRIWAIRAVELLVALILAKFAIVAVLSLGGAAISAGADQHSITGVMAGTVLITLAAFSPWALLRLVPLAEIASGAAGSLRSQLRPAGEEAQIASGQATRASEWVARTTADMKRDAELQRMDAGEPPRPARTAGGDEPPAPASAAPAGGGGEAAGDRLTAPTDSGPSAPAPPADAGARAPGPPTGEQPPPSRAERWSEQPVFELGPNFPSGPILPRPDSNGC